MTINSIEMTNWKCFSHKKIKFDKFTLLNWKNGEGKTSLIQAIILCLFDKRPDNLDFASLVDTSKPTKIILNFTYNASIYIVEREVGYSSGYKLYKDDELIARSRSDCKKILEKIISESVLTSLWGYEPLSVSNVLNSSYLYDILDKEFEEALNLKQYFNTDKTYNQKHKSTLERQITNQKITQADIDSLKNELDILNEKIKEKVQISDSEVIRAKKAKEDFAEYNKLITQLIDKVPYDRETCLRLKTYGRTEEEWNTYFNNIKLELEKEKKKASASPLTKYPRNVIQSLIQESHKNNDTCILCNKHQFIEPKIDYDTIDNNKIMRLEKILEDSTYSFKDFSISVKYWHLQKLISQVSYAKDFETEYKPILDNYSADNNKLFEEYNIKKEQYTQLDKDLSKITELLKATEAYEKDKQCISIVEKYIAEAKEYYAENIVTQATEIIKSINSRYTQIYIENGIYKAKLYDKDFIEEHKLAVQSLSKGEKTIVALSLILAIRNIFMPNLPLIMDESFANLDANNIEAIKQIMHTDKNQWIVVSHDERLI